MKNTVLQIRMTLVPDGYEIFVWSQAHQRRVPLITICEWAEAIRHALYYAGFFDCDYAGVYDPEGKRISVEPERDKPV